MSFLKNVFELNDVIFVSTQNVLNKPNHNRFILIIHVITRTWKMIVLF